jgi:hypothetical protein
MRVQYRTRGKAHAGLWRCWNHACRRWGRDVFDLVRVMRRCDMNAAVEFVKESADGVSGSDVLAALANEDIARIGGARSEPEYPVMPFPTFLPEPNRAMDTDHPYFSKTRDPAVNGSHALFEDVRFATGGEYEGYMLVPLRWGDGTTVTFQAIAVEPWAVERRRDRYPKKSAERKLYPPDAPIDRVIYGHHRARPGMTLVVSEGVMDTWRAWDAIDGEFDGFAALATMSNRVSEPQARILRHLRPAAVVALHDNEDVPEPPGLQLVLDLGSALGYTVPLFVASVPKGCDPDDAGVDGVREALRGMVSYGRWAALWATRPPDRPRAPSLAEILP